MAASVPALLSHLSLSLRFVSSFLVNHAALIMQGIQQPHSSVNSAQDKVPVSLELILGGEVMYAKKKIPT